MIIIGDKMKRMLKSRIFFFILGAIVFSSITTVALSVASKDVTYNDTNVESAINDLYSRVKGGRFNVITIYSASNDTIYYYDNDKKVELCTTDRYGNGLCPIPPKNNITLYSNIAKDPNNLSNPYSKNVTINNSTIEIYLMPSNGEAMIYWYGYRGKHFLDNVDNRYTWRNDAANASTFVTFNSNNLVFKIYQPYTGGHTHIEQTTITDTMNLSKYSHAKSIASLSHNQSARQIITSGDTTANPTITWGTTPSTIASDTSLTNNIYDVDISEISSGNIGYMQYCNGTQNVNYLMTISASWLE